MCLYLSQKLITLPEPKAVQDTLLMDPAAKDHVHFTLFQWPKALNMVAVKKHNCIYQLYPMRGMNKCCIHKCQSVHSWSCPAYCSWSGAEAEWVAEGMPHKTKIVWKPEGVGAELKATACSSTQKNDLYGCSEQGAQGCFTMHLDRVGL